MMEGSAVGAVGGWRQAASGPFAASEASRASLQLATGGPLIRLLCRFTAGLPTTESAGEGCRTRCAEETGPACPGANGGWSPHAGAWSIRRAAGRFCPLATGQFGASSYTPCVQTPFSTSRLEVGWTLIAAKYNLAPRTARRYALTYSDTLFRLRGRRLAHSGKGRSLMFTADDWALYQTLHDPRMVTGPGDGGDGELLRGGGPDGHPWRWVGRTDAGGPGGGAEPH